MKIAYVLNTYPQPSQSFIRREICALESQGHEVIRLAMRRTTEPLMDKQDIAEAAKTEFVLAEGFGALAAAVARITRKDLAQAWEALKEAVSLGAVSEMGRARHLVYLAEAAYVAERCTAEGVTHVHAHFGTNAAAVAMLAHLLGGPKYSFTVHGPEEFDSPRALSLGRKIQHADFTVGISNFGRSQLCRWAAPADWDRIKVVHCGVEPERFTKLVPMSDGPRRLVAIGRFVEQKGQLALIQAMAKITEDIHVTLVGDGVMRPEIEAMIAELGLADRITLAGWVDEVRVKHELTSAHALIMPSFAEGLPMVVMEAMAEGRPIIATYVAGTPELVLQKENGWLVPAGDSDALAAAMDNMARTPFATLKKKGAAAHARAMERHNVYNEAEKLANFMR
ncbi:MAG: glycosyltransferase family 4 protein [Sulfitobacter sp.]|nr:glycosyltransferase family 4 protein [Sulfitobacter sp.]